MTVETSRDDIRISSQNGPVFAAPPAEASNLPDIVSALRTLSELEGLTEDDYVWIATHCTERVGADGAIVFSENEPSHHLNFFLRGEVLVHRRNAGPVALFMGRTGRITGKLPYSRMKAWAGDGIAWGSFWSLDLHEDLFPAMLSAVPSMAQRCVWILLDRVREFTRADEQTVKLIAVGKLAANLAHELNNPASAARSAAGTISSNLDRDDEAKYNLGYLCQSEEELDAYLAWLAKVRSHIDNHGGSRSVDQLATSDHEDQLLNWLEARKIPNAWTIAPILAEAALPIELLETLASVVSPSVLNLAIGDLAGLVRTQRAASTVVASTTRIFDILSAIKNYSYMDQAPIQEINLAQSLENTLAMLGSRLKQVTVEREYDPNMPTFKAFGSELNQVWTALIENSLDAMGDRGVLRLSTKLKGRMVFVEVWDDGPGIDPALIARIFEPFFTTKPVGAGLGLGLDVVQRVVSKHFGTVSVESKPSSTCFQVRLPLDRMQIY
jgi:signal transduction histidine kinase